MNVFWRYWLLQIPGWIVLGGLLTAAWAWWGLHVGAALLVFALWLLKDAVVFPWLKRHYVHQERHGHEAYLGENAVAQETLGPSGYVRLRGELWRAELDAGEAPVPAGANVKVSSVDGLTLRVRR